PRESTSKRIPRALSNSPNKITNGVFPEPPAETFPTLITDPCSRREPTHPRSYSPLRAPTAAPYSVDKGLKFIPAPSSAAVRLPFSPSLQSASAWFRRRGVPMLFAPYRSPVVPLKPAATPLGRQPAPRPGSGTSSL